MTLPGFPINRQRRLRATPALRRMVAETSLNVSQLVLPLFALSNAGVTFSSDAWGELLTSRIAWGIMLGLLVGKPLGIVGFAKATELALAEMNTEQARLRELRDTLFQTLQQGIPGIKLNGHPHQRLAGNLNICIPGIVNESLILALAEDVACSSGSACATAAVDPSHVLKALGLSLAEVHASVRFGLGRSTNAAGVRHAGRAIVKQVKKLRSQAAN